MFLKQGSNTRTASESIGKAVGNDFCKFDTFLCIESFQKLYELQHEQTQHANLQRQQAYFHNVLTMSVLFQN